MSVLAFPDPRKSREEASLWLARLDRGLSEAGDLPELPAAEAGEGGSVTGAVDGREPFTLARETRVANRVHPAVFRM